MQPYTHFVIGAMAGAQIDNNLISMFSCAVGGLMPDLYCVPYFIKEKLAGRQPFQTEPNYLLTLKEISHSLPLLAILTLISLFLPREVFLFFLGADIHLLTDAFTHKSPIYAKSDQGMLWPWKFKLSKATGVWDYRYGHGILKPKPFELAVIIIFLILTALSLS